MIVSAGRNEAFESSRDENRRDVPLRNSIPEVMIHPKFGFVPFTQQEGKLVLDLPKQAPGAGIIVVKLRLAQVK